MTARRLGRERAVTLAVRVPGELERWLRARALLDGRKISLVIREALEQYAARRSPNEGP